MDMNLLPEPMEIDKIAHMYSLNRLFGTKKEWIADYGYITSVMDYLKKNGVVKKSTEMYDQINLHMLQRSLNQINEACNKLWSSIELFQQIRKNGVSCGSFNENFLTSTAVPSLHYANISAIISLLSLFGVCSWADKAKKISFYNIIRTADYMQWKKRGPYLQETFGYARRGWHGQVLQTYSCLLQNGIKLPALDLKGSERLLKERNRFDYDILTQTSMKDAYGKDKYFNFLPVVVDSTLQAIENLQKVIYPLPNGCDSRFKELQRAVDSIQ